MESKDCVPIVSGNTKYLGLSIPEWAINLLLHSGYIILFGYRNGWPLIIVQIVFVVIYVNTISKIEENIGGVIMVNRKIPNVIWGFINSIPLKGFRHGSR
jgi:hypothetical protein